MTRHLLRNVIRTLNAFPSTNSVSDHYGPSTIVRGTPPIDLSVKSITFGSYAMVFYGSDNTLRQRSVPGIALSPSNERGGHYFMNLLTGWRLHAFIWKELPITTDVIAAVEKLGADQNQPVMNDRVPLFEWAPGHPIDNEAAPVPLPVDYPDDDPDEDDDDQFPPDNPGAGQHNDYDHDHFDNDVYDIIDNPPDEPEPVQLAPPEDHNHNNDNIGFLAEELRQ